MSVVSWLGRQPGRHRFPGRGRPSETHALVLFSRRHIRPTSLTPDATQPGATTHETEPTVTPMHERTRHLVIPSISVHLTLCGRPTSGPEGHLFSVTPEAVTCDPCLVRAANVDQAVTQLATHNGFTPDHAESAASVVDPGELPDIVQVELVRDRLRIIAWPGGSESQPAAFRLTREAAGMLAFKIMHLLQPRMDCPIVTFTDRGETVRCEQSWHPLETVQPCSGTDDDGRPWELTYTAEPGTGTWPIRSTIG